MDEKFQDNVNALVKSSGAPEGKILGLSAILAGFKHHARGVESGEKENKNHARDYSDGTPNPVDYMDRPLEYPTIRRLRSIMGEDFLTEEEAIELLTNGMEQMDGHSGSIARQHFVYLTAAKVINEHKVDMDQFIELFYGGQTDQEALDLKAIAENMKRVAYAEAHPQEITDEIIMAKTGITQAEIDEMDAEFEAMNKSLLNKKANAQFSGAPKVNKITLDEFINSAEQKDLGG